MPSVPTLFHRRSCSSRHLLGVVSTLTRVPAHRRTRLTFGLHFPYRRLILCVATDARAPTIGGIGSLHYLFEEYAFDTDRRELHRGADVVPVAPQVFDMLAYLIRNRERVVSKDDLIAAIWDRRIVSDAAMTTSLNVVRGAIGDSGEEQRLIKTLPRKGFRFVGTVREEGESASLAAAGASAEAPGTGLTLPDKPSLAVLAFANLNSDPEQEYLADGIVEDIITELSRFSELFVIARTSSFQYKGKAADDMKVRRNKVARYVQVFGVRRMNC